MKTDEQEFELELLPKDLQHITAAEGYIELGMYGEADEELDGIDPQFRMLPQALVLKLCVYAGLQQWQLVKGLASKLAQEEPTNAQWAIWSASAACRADSVEAAKNILLQALQTHPDNANIHYNLSCYESRLQHFKMAERHLARAIQLDPRFRMVAMDDDDLEPLWIAMQRKEEKEVDS